MSRSAALECTLSEPRTTGAETMNFIGATRTGQFANSKEALRLDISSCQKQMLITFVRCSCHNHHDIMQGE
jgi:hypothetical protein